MGVLLFMLASAIVGARLLFVYQRLRQPPELFLGSAYLLAGTFGWGVLLVGVLTTPHGHSLAEGYQAWSVIVGDVGTFCFYLFVWYVFRRESLLAKLGLGAAALAFVGSVAHDTVLLGITYGPPPGTATMLAGSAARAAVFAWMAVEAFSQYFAFRRRARVGLGNPLVANRLLLWGLSAVVMLTISGSATFLYVTSADAIDATAKQDQAGTYYGVLAAISSLALWLAFFPPRAYQRWVEGSVEESAGGR